MYSVPLKVFRETKEQKAGFFVHEQRASSGRLRKGRREERARVECYRSRGMRKTRIFCPCFFSWNVLRKMLPTASTRTRRREKMEARPTTGEREKSEDNGNGLLWRIVMDHQDIFDTHIVTKLNGNDVKLFYDVNSESRAAVKRSGVQLPDAFKIRDFDTTSTIS